MEKAAVRMNSLRDLQSKWDRASRWYDIATAALEVIVFRRQHVRLLNSATGGVLELDFSSDPADEIIAATSLVHRLPLMTRNRKIRSSKLLQFAG